MNSTLTDFLDSLKTGDIVHFVFASTIIIGKFSKLDDKKESIILLPLATVSNETLLHETTIDIDKIVAWGRGGKLNK